jgi:dTDP-4-dehydrorhamnose reductase
MRVLIPGGDGMLGHQLLKHFGRGHEARVTLRQAAPAYERYGLYSRDNAYYGIDVRAADALRAVLAEFRPQAVINAVGIVKQRLTANESIPSIEINALFPHQLALLCASIGAQLVHISTDCVFSGGRGNYRETDAPDPDDLYGRTKLLGEAQDANCITLRTSIIGRELARKKGLLEWFLAQKGPIRGYRHSVFSGFTTIELARVIERILVTAPGKVGVYHVSSEPISKYELLTLIKRKLGLALEIVPDEDVRIDRSLDSTRFRTEFGYLPPSWDAMTEELAQAIMKDER